MANANVTIDRDKYVGGSDLPNILGFNTKKYSKPVFEFAKEKVGVVPKNFNGNEYTRYGQLMEPIIRDYINAVNFTHYVEDTTIDEDRHYRGNTDGIDRNADIPILEVKTFGSELDVDYYTPQCQFYMEVFNQPSCLLVGYKRPKDFYSGLDINLENTENYFNLDFDEANLVTHVIKRDPTYWSQIDTRIKAFQNACVELKANPDMSEDEFNKLFYGSTDLMVTANKLIALESQLASYKELEKQYDELKTNLYNTFNELGLVSFEDEQLRITKVAPTTSTTITVDTDALKTELPDIYDKYKKEKTTNRKGYVKITIKGDK